MSGDLWLLDYPTIGPLLHCVSSPVSRACLEPANVHNQGRLDLAKCCQNKAISAPRMRFACMECCRGLSPPSHALPNPPMPSCACLMQQSICFLPHKILSFPSILCHIYRSCLPSNLIQSSLHGVNVCARARYVIGLCNRRRVGRLEECARQRGALKA